MDKASWLILPDKTAYSQLTSLLTTGNRRAEKGECHLYKADVYEHARGVKFIVLPPDKLDESVQF